ncbi:hypothetical protein [Alteribacillus sp. HJP-4]|uniref:hypothetical protein n=1 Tax=Alteribacillus sp. HJP-4 TaxID=2775394 RepID=UPI0035CD056E
MKNSLYTELIKEDIYNIYNDEVTFISNQESVSTFANIKLQTSPYPEIIMYSKHTFPLKGNIELFSTNYEIKTKKNHHIYERGSEIHYVNENYDEIQEFTLYLNEISSNHTMVDRVIFFIMNCSHIGLTYLKQTEYHFEHDDWIIDFEFRPDKNIETHYDDLKRNRSFDITHIGSISKKNNKSFMTYEIEEVVSKIEWYLSFCSAQKVFIPIQFGYKNNAKNWENYIIKESHIYPFQFNYGWVPIGAINDFNIFFSQVSQKLSDELWRDVLEVVLEWYLTLNMDGMMENKIISIHIALEQIAWNYLVIQEQILDREAYNKLRATDILRLLFYQLNISRNIRGNFIDHTIIKKYNNDGVYMFVDCRNNLIHPQKKNDIFKSKDSKFIVYSQGVYFLERAITKLCGYKGKYKKLIM